MNEQQVIDYALRLVASDAVQHMCAQRGVIIDGLSDDAADFYRKRHPGNDDGTPFAIKSIAEDLGISPSM
jgi:hypothetical protein